MRLSLSAMVFTVPLNRFCISGGNSRSPVSSLQGIYYHIFEQNSNKIYKCIVFEYKCIQMYTNVFFIKKI